MAIRANVVTAARIVRDRAAQAAMPLAVIRNPLRAAVVRHHAAVGALAFAQRVGNVLLAELTQGPVSVLNGLARLMGGQVLATGRVRAARLAERLGFTVGVIKIRCADGAELGVSVCNEFMTVLRGSNPNPVAAFPDLIALFDGDTGLPLASPEVRVDHRLAVFIVPRRRLLLGSPMEDSRLLRPVERLLGMRIVPKPVAAA
jgi:DUF917 family protein